MFSLSKTKDTHNFKYGRVTANNEWKVSEACYSMSNTNRKFFMQVLGTSLKIKFNTLICLILTYCKQFNKINNDPKFSDRQVWANSAEEQSYQGLHCLQFPPHFDDTKILDGCSRMKEMSRNMTKPTKWHVRPAKTQISLGP